VLLENSAADESGIFKSRNFTVQVGRVCEGHYDVVLKSRLSKSEALIWESFWGDVSVKFSKNERYLALTDSMRFGVMSPVIVYRIEGDTAVPIYQTPSCFSAEDASFTYDSGEFTDDELEIKVYKNLRNTDSSRPKRILAFTYTINNLSKRQTFAPYFYKDDSSLDEFGGIPRTKN
jgi:hypothetical protein